MNTQTQYRTSPLKQMGFTLIEAMIAFAVAGVGILAVVALQTDLISISSQSKAKAEALQLAQVKLEEFKNYSFPTKDDFSNSPTYADISDTDTSNDESEANGNEITGTNAIFDRDYTIATTDDLKDIAVTVGWTDPKDGRQTVTLYTSLTFESQVVIAADNNYQAPTVTSATGDASIGAGIVKCGTGDGQIPCTSNGDGTSIAEDGGNLKLVIDDGDDSTDDKVVLTLEDACVSGTCTQFVQIRGSIYIDNATQGALAPDNAKVLSSDAGYCQRFYLKTGVDTNTAIDQDELVVSNTADNVTTYYIDANGDGSYDAGDTTSLTAETDITTAPSTTTEYNYDHFRYTCYLGGGWHGNIGILLSGGNDEDDKFCVGDPNVSASTDDNAPVIAVRRTYRGMTYKDVDGDPLDDSSVTKQTYTLDGATTTRYYSQGISDGATVNGHDFVIGKNTSPNTTEGDYCLTDDGPTATYPFDGSGQNTGFMTRADSNSGHLFDDVPADWYCLNENGLISPELPYGYDTECPYNPISPPNAVYVISGNITLTSSNSVLTSGAVIHTDPDTSLVQDISLSISSDPGGTCTIETFTGASGVYSSSYSCDVYDWSDDDITGWGGDIVSSSVLGPQLKCTTPTVALRTSDLSGQHIECLEIFPYDISGDIDVFATNITIDGSTNALYESSANINFAVNSSHSDICTVDPFAGSSGIYSSSYSCRVWPDDNVSGWTGDILATNDSNALSCTTPTFAAITADDSTGHVTCNGIDQVVIQGDIGGTRSGDFTGATVTGGLSGNCIGGAGDTSYTCVVEIVENTTWTGTVVLSSTKTICHDREYPNVDLTTTSDATSFVTDTASYTSLAVGTYGNEDIDIENNTASCP